MANQKIIEIIGALSTEEKTEFPLFLKSPFFVREDNAEYLLRLFSCLLKAATQPSAKLPGKTALHALVFPEKAYSDARLERAFIKLKELIEQFLVAKYYQRASQESQRALVYLGILREKKLAAPYEKKLQQLKNANKTNPLESSQFYQFGYQTAREEHEWRSVYNTGKGDLGITETVQQLDFFYFSERIELLNRLLLQQKAFALEASNKSPLDLELPAYYSRYEAQSPLLQIRKKVQELLLLSKPGRRDFELLMDMINTHEHHFPGELIRELYTYLRNFCTLLFNHGGHFEIAELLNHILKDNLARGYLYYNGKIPPYAFTNITRVALQVKNIEWAKEFIASHRYKILSKEDAEAHYNFNLALCFFAEKKYSEALDSLSFPAKFPFLYLENRRLELKIYYELRSDLLAYKIEAHRKYLERTARKMFAPSLRNLHLNFVKMLLQLMQSKPKDIKRSRQLLQRLEQKNDIADMLWLREKALELA